MNYYQLNELAELIHHYGFKIGKVKKQPYNYGGSIDYHEFSTYGLIFRYHQMNILRRGINMNDIYVDTKKDIPRVCIYSPYEKIPLKGQWIKAVEDVNDILLKCKEQYHNNEKVKEQTRIKLAAEQTEEVIKDWNKKYNSK